MESKSYKIILTIVWALVIFFLIGTSFNDVGEDITNVNSTSCININASGVCNETLAVKGVGFVRLLPLFLAFGVGIGMIKLMIK